MTTQEQKRRAFIKTMLLAGASIYLPSCKPKTPSTTPNTEIPPNTSNPPIEEKPDTIEEQVEQIDELFKSENVVFFRMEDAEYSDLNVGFNLRVPKQPKIIALCKNEEGIAESVKYAKQYKLQVCVKSGGHSFEGFSSNDGGMCINLSLLKEVEWLDDNTVKLGCGLTLKEIYDALLPKGKIIPAGSCAGVGIGGLALGGGYGLFGRKFGLTCDSMKALTLIDGNGKIHKAKNEDELLWACRGGGNGNFGVVANMTFKAHEAPKTFTRHLFKAYKLDVTRAKSLLQKWFEMTAQLPNSCFGAYVLNGKTLTVLITDAENRIAEIKPLLDTFSTSMDKTTIGEVETDLPKSLKRYYGIQTPLYFKNACAGLYKGFADIEGCIEAVIQKVHENPGLIYQVNTLGGEIANPDFEAVSAYPHRSYPYLSELQAYYEKDTQGQKLVTAFQEIQTIFTNHGISAHYRNYPDIHFENWETAYYGKNYPRLQQIKRKYDGENVIWHEQSVKV
ncbi:MAG: FAD-binding protein [Chitinophagales bacterium]